MNKALVEGNASSPMGAEQCDKWVSQAGKQSRCVKGKTLETAVNTTGKVSDHGQGDHYISGAKISSAQSPQPHLSS